MLGGLRTVKVPVRDLAAAKRWYTDVIGHGPYFDEPFYVGFDVGGYELGLVPADEDEDRPGADGVVAFWGVADPEAALARLLALGARPHEGLRDVGGGIVVASVLDPDGNVLGIIRNPHFQVK